MKTPCGCTHEIEPECGVIYSTHKCEFHVNAQREINTLNQEYYLECGGCQSSPPHCDQLVEAVGVLEYAKIKGETRALEIGGGPSPYVKLLQEGGYVYEGVEPSSWATLWMINNYHVTIQNTAFEDFIPEGLYGLVLAAHVLEHVKDIYIVMKKIYEVLEPGGYLYVVIPDDTDLCNPDHLWFFTENSFKRVLYHTGFNVEAQAVRQHVSYEKFMYYKARK